MSKDCASQATDSSTPIAQRVDETSAAARAVPSAAPDAERREAAAGAPRRRLCIVTCHHSSAHGGGAEYQIDYLIDALLPLGRYELYYLARNVDDSYRPSGYRIVPIGRKDRTLRFGYAIDAVALYRRLAEIRPDVIYQRVACGYTGVCAHYARRRGARLLWHVAHDADVDGSGSLYGSPLLVLERLSVDYAIAHADVIVVQSRQQARLLQSNYGRAADAVIPNFHPAPAEPIDKTGPVTVVWIANLKPWKRPELFVRVAAACADLRDVRFVMVGAPPVGHRRWSGPLMEAMAATPNLQYLGRRTQAEVNGLLARSHLLVNTSTQEGFPNTFIQAWMREVPVVSTFSPDDVLAREGVGIHAATATELAAAVRRLITDSRLRAELGARARGYAMTHHSLRNALQLERLLAGAASTDGLDRDLLRR
ncbi:MAG TPA: glycosyltransferase family 4 protein [Gammaproteobacteria bacterium]